MPAWLSCFLHHLIRTLEDPVVFVAPVLTVEPWGPW